jgi:conjugative transfer signal peptidase TraF
VYKPLAIGKMVTFCPPDLPVFHEAKKKGYISDGSCPNNFECLMLKVAGKRKDVVTINQDGVYVNEKLLPQSMPLLQDKEGRVLPTITLNKYELKENEVLLMTDSGNDPFDGRYFGVVDVNQVDSVISPLF